MYFRSMTLLFLFHAYDFFKTWNYTVQYVADSNSRMSACVFKEFL